MTKAQANEAIRKAAGAHGFGTREGAWGLEEIVSEEMNFTLTARAAEGTDWAARVAILELGVRASVRRMGGNPTADELRRTADEIRRGAELLAELQGMGLRWTETF